MKVAFFVRNAFQVGHLRPLFRATPGAVWLVRSRKDRHRFGLHADDPVVARRILLRRHMETYDMVVSHAATPGGKPLRRGKFVMVQYGYAKEPYNFGPWRAQANAILAYGSYATKRFSPHAPAFAIGHPRWDDWNSPDFQTEAQKAVALPDDTKPVVLYAPTWGDLSSLHHWVNHVADLSTHATVLVKAHHNSVRDGALKGLLGPNVLDVSHLDLMQALAVCDVVISDYSGAIFDALMVKRPVVLLDVPDIKAQFGAKLDDTSLELRRRDDIGYVVAPDGDLAAAVHAALGAGPRADAALVKDLFEMPKVGVAAAYLRAAHDIISG